jgi:serine/threonine protein kinase
LFVQFHGWFEDESQIYIAMEYFKHGSLDKYLEKERPSEKEVKVIARQLLEALALMHTIGFAHRNLKPQVGTPKSISLRFPTHTAHTEHLCCVDISGKGQNRRL